MPASEIQTLIPQKHNVWNLYLYNLQLKHNNIRLVGDALWAFLS